MSLAFKTILIRGLGALAHSKLHRTSQSVRSFARATGVSKRPGTASIKKSPPVDEDPWKPVQDVASGQVYWWNTTTNQTTALGAPKPTGNVVVPPPQPHDLQQQQQQGYVQQQQPGMMAGLGGAMVQGFGFGAGSAMAHNAIGSLFGGGSSHSSGSSSAPTSDSGGDDDSWDV